MEKSNRLHNVLPFKTRVELILQHMQDEQLNTREKGLEELERYASKGLTIDEGVQLLLAASESFPSLTFDWQNIPSAILKVLSRNPHPEYIPVILQKFDSYSEHARPIAITILTLIEEPSASRAIMELFRKHANDLAYFNVNALKEHPRDPEIFFPDLLDYLQFDGLVWPIYNLLLAYFRSGVLKLEHLEGQERIILEHYNSLRETMVLAEHPEECNWVWYDDYQKYREDVAYILNILGYIETPEVQTVLNEALHFKDPKLVHFTAISLLKQNKSVASQYWTMIAADHEMRQWIYETLREMNRLDLFPLEYSNQAALATSVMVNWLTFPGELGHAPAEIELMEIIPYDTQTDMGIVDFFLFRFRTDRPEWDSHWMAGVAGFFIRSEEPTTNAYRFTFSTFEAWNCRTPEEHLASIIELLQVP